MPLDLAKIRSRQAKLGLTDQQAADAAGMARPNWVRLKAGRRKDPALSTAEQVALALRCQLVDILSPVEVADPATLIV